MKVAIVGAGMAGASLAAEIAPHAEVLLIEGESQPGYHATGRSAAFWSETYGGPLVQPLTSASGPLLVEHLSPRRSVHLADADGRTALANMRSAFAASTVPLDPLSRSDLERIMPGLKPGWTEGLLEPSCADIDVAGLHAACLKAARAGGAKLILDAPLYRAERVGRSWCIETGRGRFDVDILVNAAGAWADEVARRANVASVGIQPYRRTVVQLRVDPPAPAELPLVIDALGRFYFKPEAGRIWLSPHDETPCEPFDSAAEELDVAIAIDRFEAVVDWRILQVEHRWAGLRSFAPDRLPVYGFAPDAPGFFWCAGQGGFGIQTAPAAAKLAAARLLGRDPDPAVAGIDPTPYLAARFMN
jgi:D-arginine dehydrogenase